MSRVPVLWCRELSRARLWHSSLESGVSAPGWDFQEENVEEWGGEQAEKAWIGNTRTGRLLLYGAVG